MQRGKQQPGGRRIAALECFRILVGLNDYFTESGKEIIPASSLLREFTVDIEDEKNEKDLSTGNVGYNLPSHTDDGYLRIERDIIEAAYKQEYDSYDAMQMIRIRCVKSICMRI